MKDLSIASALILVIVLFGYAIVHTARQQRQAKAAVFRIFADKNKLSYQREDTGLAQDFARDFRRHRTVLLSFARQSYSEGCREGVG